MRTTLQLDPIPSRRIFSVLPLAVLLLAPVGQSVASEFEVEGLITQEMFLGGLTNSKPWVSHLKISVKDCNWIVREQHISSPGIVNYDELGTDGTNTYRLTRHLDSEPGPNDGEGDIIPGPFPWYDIMPEKALGFLAYGSACYLQSVPNGWLPELPLAHVDSHGEPKMTKAKWKTSTEAPHLVTEVVMYSRFPQELDPYAVVTNGILRSSSFTNVGGMFIPARFEFDWFIYRDYTNRVLLSRHSFVATNIAATTSVTTFIPRMGEHTVVLDHRFAAKISPRQPIILPALMSHWPSPEETMNTAQYRELRRSEY